MTGGHRLPGHLQPLLGRNHGEDFYLDRSPQSILICPKGSMLSVSTIATTLGDSVSSQYSASTLAPSG